MMTRLIRILIGVVVGLGLLGVLILVLIHSLGDREPLYHGKTLGYLFQQMNSSNPAVSNEVRVILETDAIPGLIAVMFNDTNDSTIRLTLVEKLNELPGVNITADSAPVRRALAAGTLGQLGPRAEAAVPSLVKVVKGRDAAPREPATRALGQIHCQPDQIIPLLITCLDDSNDGVQEAAAEALGDFGPLAKEAVPKLIPWLNAQDKDKRHAAVVALPKIDSAAALQAGIK